MSTKLAANECLRQVRYKYDQAERIEKGVLLTEAMDHFASTEEELARVKKDYASRLDVVQAEIDQLKFCYKTGYEMREYVCFWEFDVPAPGRKTLRKREGGEIVTEEEMTQRDRQMVMDIIDAQAAGNAEIVPFDGEVLALPAPAVEATEEAQAEAIQRDAEKARKAEEKKKARAGRRANQSGTVSVDSDEGSRDDAGADSKNNL